MKKTKKNIQRGGEPPKFDLHKTSGSGPLKPSQIKEMQKTQINPTKKNTKPFWATQNPLKINVRQPKTKKVFGNTFKPKNYESNPEIKKPLNLEEIIGRLNRYNSEAQEHIPLKPTQIKLRQKISNLTNENVSNIYRLSSNAKRKQALINRVGNELEPHFNKFIFGQVGKIRDPENEVKKTIEQFKILHGIKPSTTTVSNIVKQIKTKKNNGPNVLPSVASVAPGAPVAPVAPVTPNISTPANLGSTGATKVAPPIPPRRIPKNSVASVSKNENYLNISPNPNSLSATEVAPPVPDRITPANSGAPPVPKSNYTSYTSYLSETNPYNLLQPHDVKSSTSAEYNSLSNETRNTNHYSTIPDPAKHEYIEFPPIPNQKTFFNYISGDEKERTKNEKVEIAKKREMFFLGMRPEDFKNQLLLEYTFGKKPENYFSNLGKDEFKDKIIKKQAEIQKKYQIPNEELEEMRGNIESTSEALRLSGLKSGSLTNLGDNEILNKTLNKKHIEFVEIKKEIDNRIYKRKAKEKQAQALQKKSEPTNLLNLMSKDIEQKLLTKNLSKINPKEAYEFAKKYVQNLLKNPGNEEVKNLYETYGKELKEKLIFKYLQKLQNYKNTKNKIN